MVYDTPMYYDDVGNTSGYGTNTNPIKQNKARPIPPYIPEEIWKKNQLLDIGWHQITNMVRSKSDIDVSEDDNTEPIPSGYGSTDVEYATGNKPRDDHDIDTVLISKRIKKIDPTPYEPNP